MINERMRNEGMRVRRGGERMRNEEMINEGMKE
jgi:hypothetical protein